MKKYKYPLIALLITCGIAVVLYGCFFLSKKITKSLNDQERVALEKEIERDQIKNLPELAKTHQMILDNELYLNVIYPEARVVEIIKDIERLAKEQNLTLTITQKEIQKKKKNGNEEKEEGEEKKPKELADSLPYENHIRLELSAEGNYLQLRNFLYKMETASYALDVLSITMSILPQDENSGARVQVDDSPFLLQGEQSVSEAPAPVAPTNKIKGLFEVALYIQ